MALEVDHRPHPTKDEPTDWSKNHDTYDAPGAREAVPKLPPIPDVTNPPISIDSWAMAHTNLHNKQKPHKTLPELNREIISEDNPLEVDVFYSMRSPYSYLALFRLAYLHSNYNVNVNIKAIFPVAVRTRKKSGKAGSGRWYFWNYSQIDLDRTGKYEGIPFRWANPDPILSDIWPPGECTGEVASMENQPYIAWLVRLANAAQLQGRSLEYCLAVSPLIFGARTKVGEWPLHVEEAVDSMGMDYKATIKDMQANIEKYDAVWQQNQVDFQMTGQGGVPTMSYNGEPFFGQDRFDQFFWRLRQNGLTLRKIPREPLVARPHRWPDAY